MHLQKHHGSPPTCGHCDAYASIYSKPVVIATQHQQQNLWTCPFCGNTNEEGLDCIAEFQGEAVDFVVTPPEQQEDHHQLSSSASAATVVTTTSSSSSSSEELLRIIAIDICTGATDDDGALRMVDDDYLDRVKDVVSEALHNTPDHVKLALIAFGASTPAALRTSSSLQTTTTTAHFDVLVGSHAISSHPHVGMLGLHKEHFLTAIESLQPQRQPHHNRNRSVTHPFAGVDRLEGVIDAAVMLLKECSTTTMTTMTTTSITTTTSNSNSPESQSMDRTSSTHSIAAHLILLTPPTAVIAPTSLGGGGGGGGGDGDGDDRDEAEGMIDRLAEGASEQGITVDVFTCSTNNSSSSNGNGALLSALAQGTGGVVVPHAAVGAAMASNLAASLVRDVGGSCVIEVRCSLGMRLDHATGAVVPLTAAGVPLNHDHHPQEEISTNSNNNNIKRGLAMNVWTYLANPPEMHEAVALVLSTTPAVASQRYLYIQCAAVWSRSRNHEGTTGDGADVNSAQQQQPQHFGTTHTRIVTKRLVAPLTQRQGGADSGAEGVLWDATAVLLFKQIAADALQKDAAHKRLQAEIIRRSIGRGVATLAAELGRPDAASRGWFRSQTRHELPVGSLLLAQGAFFLENRVLQRDGGGGAAQLTGNADCREMFLSTLMTASVDVATLMCRPELFVLLQPLGSSSTTKNNVENDDNTCTTSTSTTFVGQYSGPALELHKVPSVDVALFLSRAAVVDAGNVVYVWLSSAAAVGFNQQQRVIETCLSTAQAAACSRFPQADVVVVDQGGGASTLVQQRQVLARLTPIAGDAVEVQMKQLGQLLCALGREEIEAAAEEVKMVMDGGDIDTDESVTLTGWLRKQNVLLPGSSSSPK